MITLKLSGKSIELNTHNVNDIEMYAAKDLLVGYGFEGRKVSKTIDNWKVSMKSKLPKFQVVSKEGKNGGTYLTETQIYSLCSYIDAAFMMEVMEAFKLLVSGNTNAAMDKALSIAVPQALIDKEKRLRVIMNDIIKEKLGGGHAYSNYSKLICKCISGYIPSNLTLGDKSAFEYIVSLNHVEGAGAYIAGLEMAIMALKSGVEYHSLAAMMQVQTTKNKSMFDESK